MGLDCYICNEEGTADGSRSTGLSAMVNCGHVFHDKCIKQWRDTSQKKACPVCRKPSNCLLTLFGSNTEEEEGATQQGSNAAASAAPEERLTEQEHELMYQSHKDEFDKLFQKYTVTLEDMHIRACKYALLEQNLEKAQAGLNETQFKISMFEEMFGTEATKQFDQLISQAKK